MFEVTIGDKTYRVCFEYYTDESRDPRDYSELVGLWLMVRYTRANLFLMQGGEKIPVAFADTACSVVDNFVKEVGRKHALSRLLLTEPTPIGKTLTVLDGKLIPDFRDKSTRSAFWSAYFGRQMNDRVKNVKPPTNGPYHAYLTDDNQSYSPEAIETWAKLAMERISNIP